MKVYAALTDDISEGHVWVERPGFPERCVVKIRNRGNGQTVFCEALQFETNFLNQYNQSPRATIENPAYSIVMSYWYRARLGGLETQKDYPLDVTAAPPLWGQIRASMQHPQLVIRVAVWLGIVSVALGVLGFALGVISVLPKC